MGALSSSGDPVLPVELIPLAPGAPHAPATPWQRFVLGLDQVLERFLLENPNGLSGVVDRPQSPAMQGSPPPDGLMAPPSAPPAQSGEREGDQEPSAGGTSKAVDSVIELLWREDGSRSHSGQSSAGWSPALEPRNGCTAMVRVVRSLESTSPTRDSTSDTAGFGSQRRAIAVRWGGPGKRRAERGCDAGLCRAGAGVGALAGYELGEWGSDSVYEYQVARNPWLLTVAPLGRFTFVELVRFTRTRGSKPLWLLVTVAPCGQRREGFFYPIKWASRERSYV